MINKYSSLMLLMCCLATASYAHPSVPYIGMRQSSNNVTIVSINGEVFEPKEGVLAPLKKLADLAKDLSLYLLIDTDVPMSSFMWMMNSLEDIGFSSIHVFYHEGKRPIAIDETRNDTMNVSFQYIDQDRFRRWMLSWKEAHEAETIDEK